MANAINIPKPINATLNGSIAGILNMVRLLSRHPHPVPKELGTQKMAVVNVKRGNKIRVTSVGLG
jgi:hypothetical protein